MFIHSLYYKDHSTGWTLGTPDEPMLFDRLTLLVGASGVGKTKTLMAIMLLRRIPLGESWAGVEWDLTFSLSSGVLCRWKGKFAASEYMPAFVLTQMNSSDITEVNIEYEKLWIDGSLVADTEEQETKFRGEIVKYITLTKSILYLLREDSDIKKIFISFKDIEIFHNSDSPSNRVLSKAKGIESRLDKYKNIEILRDSEEHITVKLFIAKINKLPVFDLIKGAFLNIFPFLEDMTIKRMEEAVILYTEPPLFIYIKEKYIDLWIDEVNMSSGMYKTLMYIATLYLCPDNSLILIDEFENSLGINCIDEVTSSILSQNRNLQFILTSHHPYIINHISSEHWKILTRKGGVVKAHNAKDVGIGKSKHAAFTQLINLDMYNTGMEE